MGEVSRARSQEWTPGKLKGSIVSKLNLISFLGSTLSKDSFVELHKISLKALLVGVLLHTVSVHKKGRYLFPGLQTVLE